MLVVERHKQIMDILTERETATVSELSGILDVSAVTVRSDLNQLAEQGLVLRTHGGATLVAERVRQEVTFAARQRMHATQKQRIGELAASLIQPMESVLLDASTTALAVGQAIKHRPELTDLTVVTTGVWTALEMLGAPGLNIVLAGGMLRSSTGSVTGAIAHDVLSKLHVHRAFLGAGGVTLDQGLTDNHFQEMELKKVIVSHCKEVIAVVDSSKFGQVALTSFAAINRVTRIITDSGAPPELVKLLRQSGVDVRIT
jgi:DeoR/GlpR family transcriptional regulator of sugar metabolism